MITKYMREPLIKINKNEPITSVRALMRRFEERIAVITDENNKLLGFLTRRDVGVVTSNKSSLRAIELSRDTPIFTPDTPLEKAFEDMVMNKVWESVIIEDKNNPRILGVVTFRDIIQKFLEDNYKPRATTVSEIMSKDNLDLMIVEPDEKITKIWSKLILKALPAVIVVRSKENMIPIGIITPKDLIDRGRWRFHREGESKITTPAKAKSIMTRGVIVATPDTPIEYVAKFMAENDFSVIPVIGDDGKVIAVVTQEDVVRAYIEGAKPGAVPVKPKLIPKPVPEVERITFVKAEAALKQVLVEKPLVEKVKLDVKASDLIIDELPSMSINDTVEHARKLMLRTKSNYIVVKDELGNIVGVVTKWSMLKAISIKGPYWKRRSHEKFFIDLVLNKNPPRVKPDEDIYSIALKMLSNDAEVAIVENEKGEIMGFITKDQLVKKYVELRGHEILVENIMAPTKIGIVHPHHSLAHVITKMKTFQLDAITVAEGDRIFGVVSANRLPFIPYEDHFNPRKSRKLVWVRKLVKGAAKMGRYVKLTPLLAIDATARTEDYVMSNQTLLTAWKKMEAHNLDGIPVRDKEGKILGIVCKYDIIREIVRERGVLLEEARKEEVAAQS